MESLFLFLKLLQCVCQILDLTETETIYIHLACVHQR